jgi:hypothetical protein
LQTGIKTSEDKKYLQNILNIFRKFQSDLKSGDQFKAYLALVKTDFGALDFTKISLIDKALNENKQTKNKYRDELLSFKKKLQTQR